MTDVGRSTTGIIRTCRTLLSAHDDPSNQGWGLRIVLIVGTR